MKKYTYILFILVFLSACFKEEDPRSAIENFETIDIGEEYEDQIFYSLNDTTVVSTNSYKEWSLAFYSGDDNNYIKLNAAANMWAIKTNSTDFYASYGTMHNETDRRFDGPLGFQDNLAIDLTINTGTSIDTVLCQEMVYLLHPGIAADGSDIGAYKKFMFKGVYQGSYIIEYANLDGSDYHKVLIPKNPYTNYTSYSFETNSVVNIEPDNATWDLIFTRFTDTVYTNDGTDFLDGYSVTGAYLNENGVKAYLEEDIAYDDIDIMNIDMSRLRSEINTIGHDWKQFSDQYYIFKDKAYVIEDRDGRLFKLRFLSFYNAETGVKGAISFKFELLQ